MNNTAPTFFFQFLCLFMLSFHVRAVDIKSVGVPFVENYKKSAYQGGNQNWSITRDRQGVIYFGNSEGLLAFDGKYWQLYRMPNRLIVRAVAADDKGKVYVGGFGEFGYWAYNTQGRFAYHSLARLVPSTFALTDEIWKIYIVGEKVIFQSFASIFIYEKGKINVIKGEAPFLFLFKSRDQLFVEVLSKGLYELKNNQLHLVVKGSILGNTGVLSVLPFKENFHLIATAKNGLFVYDGKNAIPWSNQANDFLKMYQLNNGVVIQDKYFAFGTILNGIVILNEEGRVVQHLNKLSGLQNNTVLSLYIDNLENLWTGLDNGIDRIEINSPLYFYFDKSGRFGTVYSSIIYNNKIYLGTNQGLFYSDWTMKNNFFKSFDFHLVKNSQGQVWDLSLIDGKLLCGHNDGTFAVEGASLNKISSVNGGWLIKKMASNHDMLIQGTYTGLVLYKKDNAGNWVFSHKVTGFNSPSRYVEQDNKGRIWVSHAYKGLYKLTLSADLKRVTASKYYDEKNGLPGSYHVNTFNLDDQIVFSSDSGFYIYDDISDKFYKYAQLNNKLGSFAVSNKIIRAADKKYWFINHGRVALADLSKSGKFFLDSSRFSSLNGQMVQYYENISRISSNTYLISIDDGFVIFNNTDGPRAGKARLPDVLIRKVENITGRISVITENGKTGELIEIPYTKNNLRISYSLPYYNQSKIKFQYFLDGYSREWSDWSNASQKDFTNLPQGKYRFLVRAKVNDENISSVASFEFRVLPPWYASTWALLVYLALLAVLIYLSNRLYQRKLQRHQEQIRQKLQREKEEYVRQEASANEQKIMMLQNERLQADLNNKSRELTNSAMNIVYKNELLQKIRDEIYELKDSHGKKLAEDQLKKIQKVIDEGMSDERDWNLFEKSFNETHENFFKKLKNHHPQLVPNDLKFCAYLRMNMSSKEIASLLNISVRGVEIRRYRLRKKLNLDHDKNLVEFLMEL